MAQLVAAFVDFMVVIEEAVHGADRAEVDALVEQGGVDFGRGKVGEARLAQKVEHGLAFGGAQGAGRAGAGGRFDRRPGQAGAPTMDAGARQSQGAAGRRGAGRRAMTASIRICRRCRSEPAGSPAGRKVS